MCHTTTRPKHANKFLPTDKQSLAELRGNLLMPMDSDGAVEAIREAMVTTKGKHATRKRYGDHVGKNYIGWTTIMKERSA